MGNLKIRKSQQFIETPNKLLAKTTGKPKHSARPIQSKNHKKLKTTQIPLCRRTLSLLTCADSSALTMVLVFRYLLKTLHILPVNTYDELANC